MDSVIARLTWYFIHLIANVIEAIFYFGLEFRENIHNFVKNISSGRPARTLASDICEIERSIQELEKIPKHIIVIINNERKEDVDLSNLTSLIFWAMHSGVHFISFYDCRGTSSEVQQCEPVSSQIIALVVFDLSNQLRRFFRKLFQLAQSHMIITRNSYYKLHGGFTKLFFSMFRYH